jgi:hypothetical protein
MGICMGARQQKVMLWLMLEVFQDGALTYSTSRSQGSRRNFQYLTKCANGLSSYLGCLIRTRVRHNDNPQRVPPAGIAISGEDTEDTLGYRGNVVVRWNDNANRSRQRSKTRHFIHSGRDGTLTSSESPSPHVIVVKDQR